MDILLGTSLLIAIVMLGALITAANERQRKALDGIREQVEGWAQEDIRIKREEVARAIRVESPLDWLERTAAEMLGRTPGVLSATIWEKNGVVAVIASRKGGGHLVFTPVPRDRFLKAVRLKRRGILAQAETSILGDRPEKPTMYEMSVLTCGMFFDIEAAQVWQELTGQKLPSKRLAMYDVLQSYGVK